jgi:serine protease AprX
MRTRHIGVLTLVLLAAIAYPDAAPQQHSHGPQRSQSKLDRYLAELDRSASPTERVRIIVTTRGVDRGPLAASLHREDGQVLEDHPLINAITAEVPVGRLRALAARNDVLSVSTDAVVSAGADNVGLLTDNMLLSTLAIEGAADVGTDVGVAVLDSGIVSHEQIPVVAFYDFLRGGQKVKQFDDYGHGTHVAGMIRSKDDKSDARYRSVARGARLIGMKVLAANGAGQVSTVISALEFAVRNKAALKIDVINLSLGHPIYEPAATDPLVQAVEKAVAAGIVVVVASGNEGMNRVTGEVGYAGITSPGNAPSAITVGAVDTKNTLTRADDEVAAFSSRGPTWYDAYAKPDIVAPGRRVVSFMAKNSVLYNNYPGWWVNAATRTYMALSGTSMATAVTSGVVADVIAASRAMNGGQTPTPNTVKAILQFTAVQIPTGDALTQGAGSINAAGAIALAKAINTQAPVSSWWLAMGVTPTTTLRNGETLDWGQRIVWGGHIIWGTEIYTNEPAWGLHIIWGTDDHIIWGTDDDHIIWGTDDHIIWGTTRLTWGSNVVWGHDLLGFNADGTVVYGQNIDWQLVSQDKMVWGNLHTGLSAMRALNPFWNPVF